MKYDEVAKYCEELGYRDKLRLAQLLLQKARKEEELQNPKRRCDIKPGNPETIKNEPTDDINSIQYVMDRLAKLRPSKKKTRKHSQGISALISSPITN
jgi:hypothetical protein